MSVARRRLAGANVVGVVPQRVGPADLHVDEAVRAGPTPGSSVSQSTATPAACSRYWMSVPALHGDRRRA